MEFEREKTFDNLQILADQMARLSLNYKTSEDEKDDNINNDNRNSLETINNLVNNDSNLLKLKNNSFNDVLKENTEEKKKNDIETNNINNNENSYNEEKNVFNFNNLITEEKENENKINEEEEESNNSLNEENKIIINEEDDKKSNKNVKNKEKNLLNNLTEKKKSEFSISENITTITPISTTKENNDNFITTNGIFTTKENNEENIDNNEIEYINPENEEEEILETDITYFPDIRNNLKSKKNKKRMKIYDREIKHLKYKNKILDAKRQKLNKEEENLMKESPGLNTMSNYIIQKKGNYIPLFQRANQIHSQHLANIIINNEKKKLKIIEDEQKEILLNKNDKKYNPEDWENFIQKQLKWKNDVIYKRKVAESLRENNNNETYDFKPKINNNSKKIIERKKEKNKIDIFTKLYNDKEEHDERQKIREVLSLPSFQPKINKYKPKEKKKFNNFNSNKNIILEETYKRNKREIENEILLRKLNELENNYEINEYKDIEEENKEESINKKSINPKEINNNYIENNNKENKNLDDEEIPIQITEKNNDYLSNDNNINENLNLETNENYVFPENINENDNEKKIKSSNNKNLYDDDNKIETFIDDNNENNTILEKLLKIEKDNNKEKVLEPENFLYKLNIENSTPIREVEDVIIPSNNYREFFKK